MHTNTANPTGEVTTQIAGQNVDAPWRSTAVTYQNDNSAFLSAFGAAFTNMIQSCGRGASGTGYTACTSLSAATTNGAAAAAGAGALACLAAAAAVLAA